MAPSPNSSYDTSKKLKLDDNDLAKMQVVVHRDTAAMGRADTSQPNIVHKPLS